MRLLSDQEFQALTRYAPHEPVFRHHRLVSAVTPAIVIFLIVGAATVAALARAPWPVWVLVSLPALLLPTMLAALAAPFRATNWVAHITDTRLYLRFRSYLNAHFPTDTPCILELRFDEIAGARLRDDRFARIDPNRTNHPWTERSVELLLRTPDTGVIDQALAAERARRGPVRQPIPGLRTTSRSPQSCILLPDPSTIRIIFRARTEHLSPGPTAFLQAITARVRAADPTHAEHGDWTAMDEPTFLRHLAHLRDRGDTFTAVELLQNRRGCTTDEAMRTLRDRAA